MKVIAKAMGYDGKQVRAAGDVFDVAEGVTGSWFDPVPTADADDKPAKDEKPAKPAKPAKSKADAPAS